VYHSRAIFFTLLWQPIRGVRKGRTGAALARCFYRVVRSPDRRRSGQEINRIKTGDRRWTGCGARGFEHRLRRAFRV